MKASTMYFLLFFIDYIGQAQVEITREGIIMSRRRSCKDRACVEVFV